MLQIDGTTIYLTRGDTALIQLALTDSAGDPYVPATGDSIRFAMKRHMNDADEVLLEINIPTDTLILTIAATATQGMTYSKSRPYKYDVQITYSGGMVDTFIADADFYLMPEVDVYANS